MLIISFIFNLCAEWNIFKLKLILMYLFLIIFLLIINFQISILNSPDTLPLRRRHVSNFLYMHWHSWHDTPM